MTAAGSIEECRKTEKTPFGVLPVHQRIRSRECDLTLTVFEQLVHLCNYLEGIGDVDDVGLAAGPATVRVERNGAPITNEAPSNHVRLFAMTAGGKPLGVAGCRT